MLPHPLRLQAWRESVMCGFAGGALTAEAVGVFRESAWRLWRLHRRRRFDLLYVREMARHLSSRPRAVVAFTVIRRGEWLAAR